MTCQQLAAFMLEYVEGSLPAGTRERFDAHLAECDDCQAYLKDYLATMAATRQSGADDPPQMPDALVRAILDSTRRG